VYFEYVALETHVLGLFTFGSLLIEWMEKVHAENRVSWRHHWCQFLEDILDQRGCGNSAWMKESRIQPLG